MGWTPSSTGRKATVTALRCRSLVGHTYLSSKILAVVPVMDAITAMEVCSERRVAAVFFAAVTGEALQGHIIEGMSLPFGVRVLAL